MNKIRKIRAENQVTNALNTKNGSLVDFVYNLLLNFDILVWQKGNIGQTGKQTSLFKLLGIEDETYKIDLPSGPTEFRSTVVKPYLVNDENTENHSLTPVKISLITQNPLLNTTTLLAAKDTLIAIIKPSRT